MYKNAVYIQIEVILEWRFNNYCIFSPLPAKAEVLGSVRHIKILSCPDFFLDVLSYIDLIFDMWLYLDELQFKFEFRSGRMIFRLYFFIKF